MVNSTGKGPVASPIKQGICGIDDKVVVTLPEQVDILKRRKLDKDYGR